MHLNNDFVFSANNLQDYVDCPRRFELKYLLNQSWPAVVSHPVQKMEEKMSMGTEFHRLARQYLEGLPTETLVASAKYQQVVEWFDRFTRFSAPYVKSRHFTEYASFTSLDGYRLVAVFDFIAFFDDGQIIIADWKTTEAQPRRDYYQNRIQTLLYPLVAFETAPYLFEKSRNYSPSDISFLYWFPAFPEKSLEFPFSAEIEQNNRLMISNLIHEISIKAPGDYCKTEETRHCEFCRYRSLCERGTEAGSVEGETDLDIDDLIGSLSLDLP